MEDKFEHARKQGGAYADAILTDEDLLKQYKLANYLIADINTKLEIETNQLTTIQQLYESHAINIDLDDTETQKSAYDFACAECHYLEQQLLMEEVAELSEKIVSQAQQNNAAVVFPGRSLIACAAYIERNYPNVKLIKMPLSGVAKKATLTDSDLVNKTFNYVNNFLNQVPKDKNLLIVDYVNSAESLAVVKKISNGFYQDKTTCIAIYSKYSIIKSNEEFQKSESILKNTSFDAFFQAGNDQYSPLANALHKSTFDGVAPYGKHEITKKTEDQTEPYRSEDGFNLLKGSFN